MSETQSTAGRREPAAWLVLLGYNGIDDTLDCLRSLYAGTVRPEIVYVDNASRDGAADRVRAAYPDVHVLPQTENLGFARGHNVGFAYALARGAAFVMMINTDTVVAPDMVERWLAAWRAEPAVGIWVPKIYYHSEPRAIWSAGARFRRFPPVIVMRRTDGPDDGRYDTDRALDFATTCALGFPRRFLEETGLLDPNYFLFYDDYDLCLRARAAGFAIRFAPDVKIWHKVSKSTRAGSPNPFVWFHHGRSEMIFCRRHRRRRWMTGWTHRAYVLARLVVEGKAYGLKPFIKGMWAGRAAALAPVARWTDAGFAAVTAGADAQTKSESTPGG